MPTWLLCTNKIHRKKRLRKIRSLFFFELTTIGRNVEVVPGESRNGYYNIDN